MAKYRYVVRQQKYRDRFMACVTHDDFKQAVATLIRQAKAGEKDAQKLFFSYLLGLPTQPVDVTTDGRSVTFSLNLGDKEIEDDREPLQLPPPEALP